MDKIDKTLDNYISVANDFQYAINIKYDLYADDKIRNYIPTSSAIEIIEDVILSTAPSSTDRARIFVGPYGKGKSHLALVILSILCRNDKTLYDNLLSIICKTNNDLCAYIKDYQNSNKKMLPVVIQGGAMGIRQSLLFSLRKALEDAELDQFMPETYFKAAVQTIENWKNNYPDTYKKFSDHIDCSVSDFIDRLSLFDNDYYDKFVKVYPLLTSGGEFNPVVGMDVADLYLEVSKEIKAYGYEGIFVVYDEFSKYLEGNIKKIQGDEIRALQDFAELCNRSKNNQIHIMLISHKSILNYVDGDLAKTKVDNWKAVSNRFKTITLNTSAPQTYGLISEVLRHDEKWYKSYKKDYVSEFKSVEKSWISKKVFADVADGDFTSNVLFGCYPLAPVTTFMLPKISEEVAQNERTLFTFLSSVQQDNTLPRLIKNMPADKFELVLPNIIFDYFEPLFKMEAYDKPIHKYWRNASIALEKAGNSDELERSIIKTVALIYIVNRFDILPPDMPTIFDIYDFGSIDRQKVSTAITSLSNKGVLRLLDNSNYLRIAENIDININELLLAETEKVRAKVSVKDVLNCYVGKKVLYPNAYNDDNEVIRYFEFKFVGASQIVKPNDFDQALINRDGLVFGIVDDGCGIDEIVKKVSNIKNHRIVFIVLNSSKDADENIFKWFALKNYIEQSDNEILNGELEYSLNDLENYVESFVDKYLSPELGEAYYFNGGNKIVIKRKSALSALLSKICEETYTKYPVIKNELINKNMISSQAINSRAKVVNALLETNLQENLGLAGNGQEVNFMRSLLIVPGILKDNTLNLKKLSNDNLLGVLSLINKFVRSTSLEGEKSFSDLYDLLTNPKNGIGLKKGVIPIYLACVLHQYKKFTVIKKGTKEIEISARLLDSINNNPSEYFIYIENWNEEKAAYIDSLDELFLPYLKQSDKAYSDFDYVVRGIQRWYLQLPKYTKEAKKVFNEANEEIALDASVIKFANAIKPVELNSRELLFDSFIKIFGYKEFNGAVIENIIAAKTILDSAKSNLISYLTSITIEAFTCSSNHNGSLYSVLKDWYDDLSSDVKNHMFNGSENMLLNLIRDMTPDEDGFVENFARVATGIRVDDWADVTILAYENSLRTFIETIKAFESKSDVDASGGTYTLSFVDKDGVETKRTFEKAEYSSMAKLMFNDAESMIEEYGESISKNEKRQVLIDIINNLLG